MVKYICIFFYDYVLFRRGCQHDLLFTALRPMIRCQEHTLKFTMRTSTASRAMSPASRRTLRLPFILVFLPSRAGQWSFRPPHFHAAELSIILILYAIIFRYTMAFVPLLPPPHLCQYWCRLSNNATAPASPKFYRAFATRWDICWLHFGHERRAS